MSTATCPQRRGGETTKESVLASLTTALECAARNVPLHDGPERDAKEQVVHNGELLLSALRRCEDPRFWRRVAEYAEPRRLLIGCPCAHCGSTVHAGYVPAQVRAWGTVLCDGCAPCDPACDSGEEAGR